ncbi:MarR family winged helix-turn-helix transcriptional regulator [Georgenia sunbinii]|uniref:MarR family winged helix-turn-helix transcriptional regulator n=1 Tax=Georgenia sunbinii TaxID=3117728 RepID=UPI002F25FE10
MTDNPRPQSFERLVDALGDLVRRNRNLSVALARDTGLSASQVAVIGVLGGLGEVRIAELAEELWVDPSVVSRHLGPLEKTGCIERRPDPDDGRAALIRLSTTGEEIRALVRSKRRDHLERALESWRTTQIDTLADALSTIGEALGEFRGDARVLPTTTGSEESA